MSKVRETWAYGELVSSAKLNQGITDYITRGQLIHSSCTTISTSNGVAQPAGTIYIGAYPYHADKQVYDAMVVHGYYLYNWMGAASTYQLEHSINSCAAWVPTGLAGATPCATMGAPFVNGIGIAGSANASGVATIPLGPAAGYNVLAWRLNNTTPGNVADTIGWFLQVYLISTADTPY